MMHASDAPRRGHPAVLIAALFAACNGGGNGDGLDECTELSGVLVEDTVLDEECYTVVDDVYVDDGITLAVEPGVTVYFSQDTGLEIGDEGTLSAHGTADAPVTFTGLEEEERGYWKGLRFTNSSSVDNALENAVVEYAGGYEYAGGVAAAVFLDDTGYDCSLAVTDTVIRASAGHGLHLSANSELTDFSANTVTGNDMFPVYTYPEAVRFLEADSTYTGNTDDNVYVVGGTATLDETHVWQALDAPYLVEDVIFVDDGGTLSIEDGATVVFTQDAGIEVGDNGTLSIDGEEASPVTLTGEVASRGYWRGIYLLNSSSLDNSISHAVVEHAGGWDFSGGFRAGIFLDSTGYEVSVAITSTTIRQNDGYGLYLEEGAVLMGFTENVVTENAEGPVYASLDAVQYLDPTSSYTGNDVDRIHVRATYTSITGDVSWADLDADYIVEDVIWVDAGGSLTIGSGTTLLFHQDAGIEVEGALTAEGTATAPITFTGETELAGFWDGLYFHNSDSVENVLSHVTVSYGGGYDHAYADPANIALGSSGYPVSATITDCTITDSEGWGIWVSADGTVNADVETANTFGSNASGDYHHE
jgi:hypothetical protein